MKDLSERSRLLSSESKANFLIRSYINFAKKIKQQVEVKLVPVGTLYNYREIRPGKPLSRVIDAEKGTQEIVEGA